jgi:hypothetical protein
MLVLSGKICVYSVIVSDPLASISERTIYIYTLPNLDLAPIQPLRNVVTFAVDEQHLRKRPSQNDSTQTMDPVNLCVLKKTSITLYGLRERLIYQKVCLADSSEMLF